MSKRNDDTKAPASPFTRISKPRTSPSSEPPQADEKILRRIMRHHSWSPPTKPTTHDFEKDLEERYPERKSTAGHLPSLASQDKARGKTDDSHPKIIGEVHAIQKRYRLSDGEFLIVLMALVEELNARVASASPSLPKRAPDLWAERALSNENPVAFTRRVYAPWLGQGLTRALLRNLDLPLYRALSVWVHRHPEDAPPELPTVSEEIDRKVARLAAELSPDDLRKLGLALQNRMRPVKTA